MSELHQEIDGLLAGNGLADDVEDRFSCPKEIRKKAMDFLARREYGQQELVKKLANKGFDRRLTEGVIAELSSEGLQSDTRFAESFVQSRVNQGKGPVRIRLDLSQRGIADGLIEAALEESGADWHSLASDARLKKFGSRPPDEFKAKAKQMRFLQYRGFEQNHIQAAVDD